MDASPCHVAFQAKCVKGSWTVAAACRVPSCADPASNARLADLRAAPPDQRDTDAFRAACRTSSWVLYLFEFCDTHHFCNLESLLVRFSPSQVLYDVGGPASTTQPVLDSIFDKMRVESRACKAATFKTTHAAEDVARLLRVPSVDHRPELQSTLALGAVACLVHELQLGTAATEDHYSLQQGHLSQFMRLDTAAIQALNVLPRRDDPNTCCSLMGVLDHCRTPMGRRLLERWLRQPLTDTAAIARRHDLVEYLVDDGELRDDLLQEKLKGFGDMDAIVNKLKRKRAELKDLWALRQLAAKVPAVRVRLQHSLDYSQHTCKTPFAARFVAPLAQLEAECAVFVEFIEAAIDVPEFYKTGLLRVNPNVSPGLMGLRNDLETVEQRILEYVEGGIRRSLPGSVRFGPADIKYDAPGKHDDGHTLRIHKKFEKDAKKVPGFSEIKVVKAGVCFTTATLRRLSDQWLQVCRTYRTESRKYLQQAIECAATYVPVVELAVEILATLDVFVSFAHASTNALGGPYVRPVMTQLGARGEMSLAQARHPCLEAQDDIHFIPNDYDLRRADSRLQVITGPNMGGKSTYIRQLGTILVMAQVGCFVPAATAKLCVVDAVLARVGAGDAQLKGVSTFMAEMLEAAAILSTGTEDSLIIVDELGRGTSTNDGFGLAWAIAEGIARSHAFCMFATHFHELTALSGECRGVKNLHATAVTTEDSITMKYEILPGPCDRSFGIHVAALTSFPPDVVANAKRKAETLEETDAWKPVVHALAQSELDRTDDGEERYRRVAKIVSSDAGRRVCARALTAP
jgi:DNA mismatch repair protein MSH2